jgi:LmbE family N-acetylglucosaminyl deacetylase
MTIRKLAVVVAHADDAELWVGGTLIRHRDLGDAIGIWYLCCEDERRRAEARTAAAILGAATTFPASDDELRDQLAAFTPDIIVTHWDRDSHPDHSDTFERVYSLLPTLVVDDELRFRVFSCDTYNSVGRTASDVFIPTDVIDISEVWEQKRDLISVYVSQPISYFLTMVERQERVHGARTGIEFAEAFRQVVVLGVAPCQRRHL